MTIRENPEGARKRALEGIQTTQKQEESVEQTAAMCNLQVRVLPLFPNVVPTESTLECIAKNESRGFRLDSVRLDSDMSALIHENALITEHGEGNIFHYQQAAKRGTQMVGVNLYFVKTNLVSIDANDEIINIGIGVDVEGRRV